LRDYLVPFAVAFLAFCAAFLALDVAVMSLQGLTLIYQP
jgi:hypothetical protein